MVGAVSDGAPSYFSCTITDNVNRISMSLDNELGTDYSAIQYPDYSLLFGKMGLRMTKGRNTSTVAIRLPDTVIAELKRRAEKEGIGYTVLARRMIQTKLGLPHLK